MIQRADDGVDHMDQTVTRQFRPATETILTLGATLSMGMVDADTYLNRGAVFVSAQTGNLVVFVVKLVQHGWGTAWVNVPVWIGYFLGCFGAQALSEFLGDGDHRKHMRWLMLLDAAAYLALAYFQAILPTVFLIFLLGLMAGYDLTIFRQVGGIAINNGIMTGNTKSLAISSYKGLINGDRNARKAQLNILLVILTFIAGCALGASVRQWGLSSLDALWLVTVLKVLLLLWLFVPAAMARPASVTEK